MGNWDRMQKVADHISSQSFMMDWQDAAEVVGYYRRKLKVIGYMVWIILIPIAILSAIYLPWYTVIIEVIIAFCAGALYAPIISKRIQIITGMNFEMQQAAYPDSLAAKNDPIVANAGAYKKIIDSIISKYKK